MLSGVASLGGFDPPIACLFDAALRRKLTCTYAISPYLTRLRHLIHRVFKFGQRVVKLVSFQFLGLVCRFRPGYGTAVPSASIATWLSDSSILSMPLTESSASTELSLSVPPVKTVKTALDSVPSAPDSAPTAPDSAPTPPDSAPSATLPIKAPSAGSPDPPMASQPPSPPLETTERAAVSSVGPNNSSPAAAAPSSSITDKASTAVKSSSSPGRDQATQSNPVKSSANTGSTKAAPTGAPSPTGAASPTGSANPASQGGPSLADGKQISFTGTTTSTITDAPESTLAAPSFIPVVDSKGKTSFTAPPLVTILSTSTEANGSTTVLTHVVANPTGFSQAISGGRASFFRNAGAVAGVFLVVGALLTGIAAFGIFILCRRRRRRREAHRRWLISINRPRPAADEREDPFQDPRTPPSPQMRGIDPRWDVRARTPTEENHAGLGLYNLPSPPPPRRIPSPGHGDHLGEHEERHSILDRNEIGLAITTNNFNQSRPSLAQSSPSIYPPSLPPANDDHPFEEAPSLPQRYSDASVAPPRPRRSHLRDPPSTAQLVTPPSSISSHSPVSEFAGPFGFTNAKEGERSATTAGPTPLDEIIGRRTLLDVRPRSRDSVGSKNVNQRG
ncbi:hypothetical protein C8R43DRAFT_711491 [Mycena crocata]|nr:hypothetical protein C8R43DRAFT_711491 [Mycena crocata]